MSKYQEALNNAIEDIKWSYHDCGKEVPKERFEEIKLLQKLIDKNEKMENAIKEVISRNKQQQIVYCFTPKTELEREKVYIFCGILNSINKTLEEVLEDE